MDDMYQVKNPQGKFYTVRYEDVMKIARIHLGLSSFDEKPESLIVPNMHFYEKI